MLLLPCCALAATLSSLQHVHVIFLIACKQHFSTVAAENLSLQL